MSKTVKSCCTLEFEPVVVWLVQCGQSRAAAARRRGLVEQTLFDGVKASRSRARLSGADIKPVSAKQMEISRLHAELVRAGVDLDLLEMVIAFFANESLGSSQVLRAQPAPDVWPLSLRSHLTVHPPGSVLARHDGCWSVHAPANPGFIRANLLQCGAALRFDDAERWLAYGSARTAYGCRAIRT